MENRLDLGNCLGVHKGNLISPDEVTAELGQQSEKETHGFVKGVVKEYERVIESCEIGISISTIMNALGATKQ